MGGGAPSIPQRSLTNEFGSIFNQFPKTVDAYKKFVGNEPLLAGSNAFALGNLQNIGQLTGPQMEAYKTLPGQLDPMISQLGGYGKDIGQSRQDVGALAPQLQGILGDLGTYGKTIMPTILSGGALTPEQSRNVTQDTLAGFAQQGNVSGNQALGATLLNRDAARQARFGQALGQGLGVAGAEQSVTGSLANLYGTQAGLSGAQAGITGQQAGLVGQKAGLLTGLAQGVQGLQQGVLGQTLGTETAQTGNFGDLFKPLLSYGSDLFSSNQNAAAAKSIAGANKSAGALGGGASAIGAIGGGLAIAL